MLEIKELTEASVIYVNLDPDKVESAMRKAGYDEEEYFEFIYDKYGFEDGEDFQTGNDHLELGFYSDTNKAKLNKLKKDLGESVELEESEGKLWMGKYTDMKKKTHKVVFYCNGDSEDAEDELDSIIPVPYTSMKVLGTAPNLDSCIKDGFELIG